MIEVLEPLFVGELAPYRDVLVGALARWPCPRSGRAVALRLSWCSWAV